MWQDGEVFSLQTQAESGFGWRLDAHQERGLEIQMIYGSQILQKYNFGREDIRIDLTFRGSGDAGRFRLTVRVKIPENRRELQIVLESLKDRAFRARNVGCQQVLIEVNTDR